MFAQPEAPATGCCGVQGVVGKWAHLQHLLEKDSHPHRPPTAPLTGQLLGRSGTEVLGDKHSTSGKPRASKPFPHCLMVTAGTLRSRGPHHPAGAAPSSAPSAPLAPPLPCEERKGRESPGPRLLPASGCLLFPCWTGQPTCRLDVGILTAPHVKPQAFSFV